MSRKAEEAIILAGGLGTRLRSVVPKLPKPLAPVAGRPFLAWLLDQIAAAGLRRVILATGYRADQIERVIGTHWGGMAIAYSCESEPLGTGGAVALAARHLLGNGVHLANGDTFLRYQPQRLEQLVLDSGALIGMALAHVADVARYGAVTRLGARVTGFQEKGSGGAGLINAGSYFLSEEALTRLPLQTSFSFETSVLMPLAAAGKVVAMDETCDFIDIGVPVDYARAAQLLAIGH